MAVFEAVCALLTLASVALLAFDKDDLGWPTQAVGCAGWAVFAAINGHFALLALNVIMLALAGYAMKIAPPKRSVSWDPGPPTVLPNDPHKGETRCCQMAAKFMIGVIAERNDIPVPTGLADYIEDWNPDENSEALRSGVGRKIFMRFRFCPFCGTEHSSYTGE